MNEIQHNQLAKYLTEKPKDPLPGVFLIHGQEMLVDKSSRQIMTRLIGGESADLCCEKIEGNPENLADAIERLNTFSLLVGPKIVMFTEAKLFEGRRNLQRLLDQTVDAWQNEDEHQAAKSLISLISRLEIDLDDVLHLTHKHQELKTLTGQLGTDGIGKLLAYCRDKGWSPTVAADHTGMLIRAMEKGFPQNHHLIVTVHEKVPKNLKLYKAFRKNGMVIDCNIPGGERRADKMAQEAVLRQALDELLVKANKHMAPGVFQKLCTLTGFDPRVFVQNVEKLIDYVGSRAEISTDDIQAVLKRTKVDPVFELTNAAADRNLVLSLFYLKALLDGNWHPLPILAALTNQMRKLLIAKSFAASEQGSSWTRGMNYQQFQKSVMPAIKAHDKLLKEQAAQWNENVAEKTKKKAPDVVLAPNPNSAYPVYQTMMKSEKYALQELVNIMSNLNETDLRLKSTGQDAALVLKKTLLGICGNTHG